MYTFVITYRDTEPGYEERVFFVCTQATQAKAEEYKDPQLYFIERVKLFHPHGKPGLPEYIK